MSLKTTISRIFQRFSKWTVVTTDLPEKAVLIGAPHTSNWDGVFMVVALWSMDRPFKFLVKDSLLNNFFTGPLIRWIGGIGVDRTSKHGLVDDIVRQVDDHDQFTLIIAPKGTRSPQKYWKSGFYHIAHKANLPVYLGFIDRGRMTYGFKDSMYLTGDIPADMDRIREYYDGIVGMHPEKGSVPRLRVEDE